MLDINFIRDNQELVKKAILDKGVKINLDDLLNIDQKRREALGKVEELRRQRNEAAEKRDIEAGRKIKEELDGLEEELRKVEEDFNKLVFQIPNVPLSDVPEGDESNNQIIKVIGDHPGFNFAVKDHVELGEKLGILDLERAAKVSGARFVYLKNEGVMLELALVSYAMQKLSKSGFNLVFPPALIKKEVTEGLGYWQGMADAEHSANENYYLVKDDTDEMYLVGTGEHSVVPMYSNEILREDELPKKYAAFSSCFRREVGKGGQDVRGILRVHQFDKVEMVAFVKPEDDQKVRDEMLKIVEEMMSELGLPYRLVKLATGDMSLPAAQTIDIETWIPSQEKYRETHSISTTTDFQSRRLKIRYRDKDNQTKLVHILNGTAFAIGRILIAILENFQQADGSVKIPEVLHSYTNFEVITPKA